MLLQLLGSSWGSIIPWRARLEAATATPPAGIFLLNKEPSVSEEQDLPLQGPVPLVLALSLCSSGGRRGEYIAGIQRWSCLLFTSWGLGQVFYPLRPLLVRRGLDSKIASSNSYFFDSSSGLSGKRTNTPSLLPTTIWFISRPLHVKVGRGKAGVST